MSEIENPETIQFVVPGEPRAKGRPRSRHVKTKGGREFTTTYTDSKTASYENLVKLAASEQARRIGWSIPDAPAAYDVRLRVGLPIPLSWPAWKRKAALEGRVKPRASDIDNYIKSLLDGCNQVIWSDDSEVYAIWAVKEFVTEPNLSAIVLRRAVPTKAGQ